MPVVLASPKGSIADAKRKDEYRTETRHQRSDNETEASLKKRKLALSPYATEAGQRVSVNY